MPIYLEDALDMTVRELLGHLQNRLIGQTKYFDIWTMQSVTDYWVYQEIITENRPDVLVEIGNFIGGSTLALAHLFDTIGSGRIIAIDINHQRIDPKAKAHPRITWIESDAKACIDQVKALIKPGEKVMIIEDSSHTYVAGLFSPRHKGAIFHN